MCAPAGVCVCDNVCVFEERGGARVGVETEGRGRGGGGEREEGVKERGVGGRGRGGWNGCFQKSSSRVRSKKKRKGGGERAPGIAK